jgi:predicted MFS family arabinose efflux permease
MTRWLAMPGAIFAGVAALLIVNALPALVTVIASGLGWDDRALGLLASADVAGITLGSLAGVPIVRRSRLRTVVIAAAIALVLADVGCASSAAKALIVAFRLAGGLASGLILAACYAIYSDTHPQRNFAIFSIGQMVSGFIAVTALPLLADRYGWRSGFFAFALFSAIAIPLALPLPARAFVKQAPTHRASGAGGSGVAVWLAVAGVIAFVIGEGAVWTFMERMGAASGIPAQDVNTAVSACTLAGLLGAAVMMFPSNRLGVALPLIASMLLSAAAVAAMRSPIPAVYIASLCAFNFAWLAFGTVQFAVIANADRAGTATVAMSAASFGGFTIGPYVAGELAVRYGFFAVQCLGLGGILFALVSLIPLVSRRTILLQAAPTRTD